MKSWSRLPYRCRVCRKRFYRLDLDLVEQRDQELDLLGEQEVVEEIAAVSAPTRRRRYRVVIRIRLPRLLRPREV
jgi:hypothetical protein